MRSTLIISGLILAIFTVGIIITQQPNDIEQLENEVQTLSGKIHTMTIEKNTKQAKVEKFYKIYHKEQELEKQITDVKKLKSDILSNGWLVSPSSSSGNT